MLESVTVRNFKALRDATVPLSRFTLLIGPNGSGKTTVGDAILAAAGRRTIDAQSISAGVARTAEIRVDLHWGSPFDGVRSAYRVNDGSMSHLRGGGGVSDEESTELVARLRRLRGFNLDATAIMRPARLTPRAELGDRGEGLAIVLDRLRDEKPERFEELNAQLRSWIPEFDRILFDVPTDGGRAISLRTKEGQHTIPADQLSHGTVLALALLTLAYGPVEHGLVILEEPDRGIHPRLLRDVVAALHRLSHPEERAP